MTLLEELDELHEAYVVAINQAIDDGELARAEELASHYDADAIELIAKREGKQHLLPLVRRKRPQSAARRFTQRLVHP